MNTKGVVFLVCTFVLSTSVLARPGTLSEDVVMFKDICMSETNVTPDQLIKYNNQDPSVEQPIGCYSDCLSRKLGFTKEDNSLDPNGVIEMLSTEFPEEKVDDFMKTCTHRIGTETCEVTLKWLECDEEIIKKVLA